MTDPVPSATAVVPANVPVSVTLKLVGAVPYADRFSATLWINGTEYNNGFCGFSDEKHRCAATTYSWDFPSVQTGTRLNLRYTWEGNGRRDFVEVDRVPLDGELHVVARCAYQQAGTSPRCERVFGK